MKKLLLITYHYPPSAAVGAIRPSKCVRYLPELGWQPIVLTVSTQTATGDSTGETADIYRAREWPHPLKAYATFKMRQAQRRGTAERLIAEWNLQHGSANEGPPETKVARLKEVALSLLNLPDQETGWLIPTILRGLWLTRQKGITHVLTTGPPFSCHLAGLALKQVAHIKWVADFRDPWLLNNQPPIYRNYIRRGLERRLIRSVMKRADLVVSVTAQSTEYIRKEHPKLDSDKFVTITNGFDPEDFRGMGQLAPPKDPIIFSYVGTFYYGRTPRPFLRALKNL